MIDAKQTLAGKQTSQKLDDGTRAGKRLERDWTTKNQRIVVTKLGGPELMPVIEEDAPLTSSGEVRVRVLASGVSFADFANAFDGRIKCIGPRFLICYNTRYNDWPRAGELHSKIIFTSAMSSWRFEESFKFQVLALMVRWTQLSDFPCATVAIRNGRIQFGWISKALRDRGAWSLRKGEQIRGRAVRY